MKVLPTTGMPFNVYEQIQAQKYGHPATYPNSENILPPRRKEEIRVIEQSTRAQVNLDVLKKWQEQKDRVDDSLENLRLRAFFNKLQIEQGAILDIEV